MPTLRFLSDRVTVKKIGRNFAVRYKKRTILLHRTKKSALNSSKKLRRQIKMGATV